MSNGGSWKVRLRARCSLLSIAPPWDVPAPLRQLSFRTTARHSQQQFDRYRSLPLFYRKIRLDRADLMCEKLTGRAVPRIQVERVRKVVIQPQLPPGLR